MFYNISDYNDTFIKTFINVLIDFLVDRNLVSTL